jgi:hypothetical protein
VCHRFEQDGKVDITVRAVVAAGGRAKERETANS